jgi:hypothetical protein
MKTLEIKEKILLALVTIASLYVLFFLLRSCNPEPTPIATNNSQLEEYLREEIRRRDIVNDRLWDSIGKLQERKEKVEIRYKVIREKVAIFTRPQMQEYYNELSQTPNEDPYVNLDSVGAINVANKVIDGQVAKAKLNIAEEQLTLQGDVISNLNNNISDLNALNENAEQNIQTLEKSLQKQKKALNLHKLLFYAALVGIAVK